MNTGGSEIREIRMPEYTGIIKDKALKNTRPELLEKWIAKNDGEWFRLKLSLVNKYPDPKTREQLGYYWGLLVPEITKQLESDGHTITISAFKNVTAERKYTELDTHELLTSICNHVGPNGALMRMSDPDMNIRRMMMIIDNVLNFATQSLSMNGDDLRAWRPELEK